ncbi:MAG: ASCH domain-containing protein [Clostridia bacterium]|nr:ASCH domain-containing protein [Clostridia bacterium]
MKTHEMKLLKEPFLEIKEGRKTVEMRLFDEKRRGISAGDEIVFSCPDLPEEELCVRAEGTYIYEDFRELAAGFPAESLGFPGRSAEYIADYMENIYSSRDVEKYGAFAIKIILKNNLPISTKKSKKI